MTENLFKQYVDKYYAPVHDLADYLTEHPEISCEEENSSRQIIQLLQKYNYEVTTPYAGMPYSFLAVDKARKNDNGPKAAFLCEYDALPEVGHACGHSYSCAISVLGALALRDAFPDLPYRIDIIGTPAEEYGGGKCIMTDNGGFDDYEFAAMIHLSNVDKTFFKVPACNDRYFTFHGKAAHASAAPEEGVNALNAARLFMEAMDMWRQHLPKDNQFHGIVVKGGIAPNIVPDDVQLDYYFRAETITGLWKLNKTAEICAKGAAMAVGATVEWQQRYPDYADIYWDDIMEAVTDEIYAEVGRYSDPEPLKGGSSDIGNISMKIPVFHMMIDITNHNPKIVLHDKAFEKMLHTEWADKGLEDGACIMAGLGYKLATNPELMKKIKTAQREYRKI